MSRPPIRNSRYCTRSRSGQTLAPEWDDPQGVADSAILFGRTAQDTVPLIKEARGW